MGPVHRLLLLRHAKSSWDQLDAAADDHHRPLAPRGRRAAAALSAHLRGLAEPPDLVLCSSAARTVETLERIRPALPAGTSVASLAIAQRWSAVDAGAATLDEFWTPR